MQTYVLKTFYISKADNWRRRIFFCLCSFNWKCKPLWTYELMDGKNNERGSFERRKNHNWMVERGTRKLRKKWVTLPYVTGGHNTFIYWMGFNCCNIIKNIIIINHNWFCHHHNLHWLYFGYIKSAYCILTASITF